MGFRRKGKVIHKSRERWIEFCEVNASLIREIGLTLPVVSSEERFVDFLEHGYIDHHDDPTRFTLEEANEEQYAKFKELVDRYFAFGYPHEWVTDLCREDQEQMRRKYEPDT